ncbi:MAG: DUF4231 domain-containing protein [Caldilineaceae bacterium]|nr:DUF4231 domain-containing protein [Caldilineaceae bacterium]
MKSELFDSYLEERYESQVHWYESRSGRYKSYYHIFQWLAIILSSTLPAVIVLTPEGENLISVIPSIFLAIVTSALKSFKLQENWVSYRTIAETLKKEKHYFDAEANGYAAVENKEQFFIERVETLISRENTMWLETHSKSEERRNSQ